VAHSAIAELCNTFGVYTDRPAATTDHTMRMPIYVWRSRPGYNDTRSLDGCDDTYDTTLDLNYGIAYTNIAHHDRSRRTSKATTSGDKRDKITNGSGGVPAQLGRWPVKPISSCRVGGGCECKVVVRHVGSQTVRYGVNDILRKHVPYSICCRTFCRHIYIRFKQTVLNKHILLTNLTCKK